MKIYLIKYKNQWYIYFMNIKNFDLNLLMVFRTV